jgi:Resolvase, N terminal domain
MLVVWKLDRLGRSLRHLVNVVHDLTSRGIGLKVLSGQGAAIDTTTPAGKLVFGIFASLAEFERDLISERTRAGLASARARGRKGGPRPKMTAAKIRLAMAAMGKPETKSAICAESWGLRDQHFTDMCHPLATFVVLGMTPRCAWRIAERYLRRGPRGYYPPEVGFTDLIQAMTFHRSSTVLIVSPNGGIGPTTNSEPLRWYPCF